MTQFLTLVGLLTNPDPTQNTWVSVPLQDGHTEDFFCKALLALNWNCYGGVAALYHNNILNQGLAMKVVKLWRM